MNIASSIGLVTGGLSLVAFIIAAGLYAYRAKLQNRLELIGKVPPSDRAAAINDTAEYLRIDTSGMSNATKERIILEQLRQKSRRDLLWFVFALVIAALLALIALASMSAGNARSIPTEFSAIGDHVKVDCDRDGRSNVTYTADSGYHILNVHADVYDPKEVRNTGASVTSNNGRTATASATFSGKKTNLVGDCPSSGSAQVRIYGTLTPDRGWLVRLYELIFSGFLT